MKTSTKLTLAGAAGLAGLGWLGLQIPPENYPRPEATPEDLGPVTLPSDLPPPVERYLKTAVGEKGPRIETALVWGRARFRLGPVWFPMRYRAFYRPGQAFRRQMELTWFGQTLFRGEDSLRGGQGRLQINGLVNELFDGPKITQAQYLAAWGEALWTPSVFAADSRLRWEAVGASAARLLAPAGSKMEPLEFLFNPDTGLVKEITAMRYRGQEKQKTLWRAEYRAWKLISPPGKISQLVRIPGQAVASWADEPAPYGIFNAEGVIYNLDVSGWLS